MTDIQEWPELVTVVKLRSKNPWTGEWHDLHSNPIFGTYVQVPLNEYQMGNLLGAVARAEDNGDWWHELCSIIGVAMDKAGIKELTNNFGDTFKLDDVRQGILKETT